MDAETRFIADVMLGKLATWLRLLGCDVEYFPKITDEDLVGRASRTGRVILTRDTELIRRRQARGNHFFVRGGGYRDQLRQVADRFSIVPFGRIMTRCLRSNRANRPPGRFATQGHELFTEVRTASGPFPLRESSSSTESF